MSDTLTFNVPTALMPALSTSVANVAPSRWNTLTVETLRAAEEALDEVETNGSVERELVVRGPSVFVVRWR